MSKEARMYKSSPRLLALRAPFDFGIGISFVIRNSGLSGKRLLTSTTEPTVPVLWILESTEGGDGPDRLNARQSACQSGNKRVMTSASENTNHHDSDVGSPLL